MADDNKKYISKIVKGGETLYIKDADAQAKLDNLTNALHWIGVSSTEITDGASSGPWTIGGYDYIASGTPGEGEKLLQSGDVAAYTPSSPSGQRQREFVWSGSSWQEFGSTGSLGNLAYANTASASYTPAGTNASSSVSFSPAGQNYTQFVTGFNQSPVAPSFEEGAFSAGTLPSFTEGAFSAGTLPSLGTASTTQYAEAGETSSYNESTETLTFTDASKSAAVTGYPDFSAGTLPSKAADTWSAGSLPSKASDTWSAGTVPTLSTSAALTPSDSATAAAQTFSGTAATIQVLPDARS